MNTILLVFRGVELLTTIGPIAINVATALKALFDKPGSDYSAEIVAFENKARLSVAETEAMIAAWKAEKGFTD